MDVRKYVMKSVNIGLISSRHRMKKKPATNDNDNVPELFILEPIAMICCINIISMSDFELSADVVMMGVVDMMLVVAYKKVGFNMGGGHEMCSVAAHFLPPPITPFGGHQPLWAA